MMIESTRTRMDPMRARIDLEVQKEKERERVAKPIFESIFSQSCHSQNSREALKLDASRFSSALEVVGCMRIVIEPTGTSLYMTRSGHSRRELILFPKLGVFSLFLVSVTRISESS